MAFPVSHGRAEPAAFKDDVQNVKPKDGPDNRYFRGTLVSVGERPVNPDDPDSAMSPCAVIRSRSTGVVDVEGWEDPTHDPHRGATTALPRPAPPKD